MKVLVLVSTAISTMVCAGGAAAQNSPGNPAPSAQQGSEVPVAPAQTPAARTTEPVQAAGRNTPDQLGDIVVTARRRDESLQNVPVVVTAFNKDSIERYGLASVNDIATLTPAFRANTSGGGTQGTLSIRGVSTGFLVTAGNQAVSLNVDGLGSSQSSAYQAAQIDLQGIEVLKGPQALFFGKNSTAGIISIRSADPTQEVFTEFRGGYEFTSRQRYGQFVTSGPVTDDLSARAVVYYSNEDGWLKNTSIFPVENRRAPNPEQIFTRGTLLWRPSDAFSAKLKLSYYHNESDARETPSQRVNCVAPRLGDDCKADNRFTLPDVPGRPPFSKTTQYMAVLDVNAKVADQISIQSITGYQNNKFQQAGGSTTGELISVPVGYETPYETASEEVRLASSYSGPLNFTVGGIYEYAIIGTSGIPGRGLSIFSPAGFFGGAPGAFGPGVVQAGASVQRIKSDTYSAYGQLSFKPIETIEIAGGARYSRIDSSYSGFVFEPGTAAGATAFGRRGVAPLGPIPTSRPNRTFENVSPEATLTWRPRSTVTLFAAYKQGFKAGGFDVSTTNNPYLGLSAPRDITYGSEQAKGGEAGFKTEWFNRTLRFNASYYYYDYSDLQLSAFDPVTVAVRVTNVGKSRVQGVDAELLYLPTFFEGLTLFSSVNYNRGRFVSFTADCTQSQILGLQSGCVDRNGVAGLQTSDANNAAARRLPLAPDWTGNFGFNFDGKNYSGGDVAFRTNFVGSFSSSYNANSNGGGDPIHEQRSYVQLNAGAALYSKRGAWELNLRVDNITQKYYRQFSVDLPNFPLEAAALVSKPRTIRLEVVLRPSAFN